MSRENVEFVREIWAHLAEEGTPPWSTLAEDVEVHDHDLLDVDVYRGRDGFARWIENWESVWEDSSLEPAEFVDAGDRVVVVLELRATARGGLSLERRDALVYTLRNREITRLDYYNNAREALEAVGLREPE